MMDHPPLARLLWLVPALLALTLTGCGGGCCEEYYYEEVVVYDPAPIPLASIDLDNLSPEFVDTFFLSPAGTGLWTEELLGWPLAPGETAYIGEFQEDWYDAEADTELGDLVQWFDVFAPGGEITIFEVW